MVIIAPISCPAEYRDSRFNFMIHTPDGCTAQLALKFKWFSKTKKQKLTDYYYFLKIYHPRCQIFLKTNQVFFNWPKNFFTDNQSYFYNHYLLLFCKMIWPLIKTYHFFFKIGTPEWKGSSFLKRLMEHSVDCL